MSDPVTSPDHYKAGQYECLDIMRARFGEVAYKAFCTMNAFKYLFRAGRKTGLDGGEDAAKAKHYLELAPDCSMPDELERQLVEANRLNLRLENDLATVRKKCVELHAQSDAVKSELDGAKTRVRNLEEQLTTQHNVTADIDKLRVLHRDQVMARLETERENAKLRKQLAKLRKRKPT